MMVLEQNPPMLLLSILAIDLVRCCHEALQQAIFSDNDQHIGLALDALEIAYGTLHKHEQTFQFYTIAVEILLEIGDCAGAALALYHAQVAIQMLSRQH